MTDEIRNPLTHFVLADDISEGGDYEIVFSMRGETGNEATIVFTTDNALTQMAVGCQLAAHAIGLARSEGFDTASAFLDDFANRSDNEDFDISDFM